MEFSEKYVFYAWNDGLKNKECYIGETLQELKNNVAFDENKHIITEYSGNDFYPFTYTDETNNTHSAPIVYCKIDKYEKFRKAQNEGKEVWCKFSEGWISNKDFGNFTFENEIKNYTLENPHKS